MWRPGAVPANVVNREVAGHPRLREKLRGRRGQGGDMRDNTVKRTLATGGVSVGTMMLEFATTGIGRIAAEAGAEFAVFDMEHTGWSMETIRQLMATSRAADIVPLVRVPTLQYHFIARVLDVGAMGVVVPLVADAEQARTIVECAEVPPRGSARDRLRDRA